MIGSERIQPITTLLRNASGLERPSHQPTSPIVVNAISQVPTGPVGTEPGVVLGTVGYLAPEQLRGQATDHRADIFAFGAILYELLSGYRAFGGDTSADTISLTR